MITAVVLALTALGGVLTVTLLGGLKQLAEIQVAFLQGREVSTTRDVTPVIPSGVSLPTAVLDCLPAIEGRRLIAVLSEGCPQCVAAARLLASRPESPLAVGILGPNRGEVLSILPSTHTELSLAAVSALSEEMHVVHPPVVIVEENGMVIGSGHSDGVTSEESLSILWGGSPTRKEHGG